MKDWNSTPASPVLLFCLAISDPHLSVLIRGKVLIFSAGDSRLFAEIRGQDFGLASFAPSASFAVNSRLFGSQLPIF
jgi:hypothetical protein